MQLRISNNVAHNVIILIIYSTYSKPLETNLDIKLSSDSPQLPDTVTHWLTPQRPYTTLLLTHR